MTEVPRAQTDADFIAMVPALIGYHATNSLVCVAFNGKQAFGGFRIDLPPRRRTSDYRAVATTIIGMLSRVRGANRVAPVIITDATFADENGVPWVDFARYLADRLEDAGFGMVSALCVAADGWANYFDPDYPRAGRPLAEIASSPMQKRAEVMRAPALSEWATLPEVTDDEIDEFAMDVVAVRDGDYACELMTFEVTGLSGFIEHVAETEAPLPPAEEALLLLTCQAPSNRDVITMQVAFGDTVGEAVAADNEELLEIQARTGGSMDDVVRAEIAAGRRSLEDDDFSKLLMGVGTMRPDVRRMESTITKLKRIVALAPAHYRLGPLCILAWLLWGRGLGSAAGHFVDSALAIDPEYGMALVLRTIFSSGRLPEWVYSDGSR